MAVRSGFYTFIWLFAGICTVLPGRTEAADREADNTQLYYAAKEAFSEPKSVELRLGGGYDLSNPYLNIFSVQGTAYFLASSDWAFGLEATTYFASKRSSTLTLEQELAAYNYTPNALSPNFSMVGLVRVTPISGLVNFFSYRVLQSDVSLIARGGTIQYKGTALGPLLGIALETHIGITPTFGVHTSIQWDYEKPGTLAWQWRSGFRMGPSFKF